MEAEVPGEGAGVVAVVARDRASINRIAPSSSPISDSSSQGSSSSSRGEGSAPLPTCSGPRSRAAAMDRTMGSDPTAPHSSRARLGLTLRRSSWAATAVRGMARARGREGPTPHLSSLEAQAARGRVKVTAGAQARLAGRIAGLQCQGSTGRQHQVGMGRWEVVGVVAALVARAASVAGVASVAGGDGAGRGRRCSPA